MKIKALLLIAIRLSASFLSFAQPKIKLDTFSRTYTGPVEIANDGFTSRLFILQQNGIIWAVDSNGVRLDTFIDLRSKVQTSSEQGLLGLAFHPDFRNNGYFYTYYTKKNTSDNALFRYKVSANPNRAIRDSESLVINLPHPGFTNHNGGCIRFGNDGYLYIGVGDGGSSGDPNGNAQNRNTLLGKILRLDVSNFSLAYTIPPGNPFSGQSNVKQEIWAYGLRNPWRFSFDRQTQDLWIGDVGQNAREEVDFQAAGSTGGENYGWRCYEGNNTYNTSGCGSASNYVFPVFTYDHSSNGGVAVTGGYVYRGNKYADLKGYYLCADYTSNNFWAIKKTDAVFTNYALGKPLTGLFISSFGEDIYGELYASNSVNGVIYKIRERCSPFQLSLVRVQHPSCPAITNGSVEFTSTGANGTVVYNWSGGGSGNTISNLAPGKYTVTATDGIGCIRKDSVLLFNADTLDAPLIQQQGPLLQTDSGYAYIWKLNGDTIAGADKDTIRPSASGNYQVAIKDGNGCKAESATFSFVLTGVRIKPNEPERFSVFPNPAKDNLTVDIRFSAAGKSTLKVMNAIGQIVYSEQIQGKDVLKTISLQSLPKGIYQLCIYTDDGRVSRQPFVKE